MSTPAGAMAGALTPAEQEQIAREIVTDRIARARLLCEWLADYVAFCSEQDVNYAFMALSLRGVGRNSYRPAGEGGPMVEVAVRHACHRNHRREDGSYRQTRVLVEAVAYED